ncbi:4-methyl-5-nitrocatechol 5-monooxygenase [Alphaproteobacteria bacterium SO-S41]|nr:4-methyl-5-nitrocatechol 5-monooxygenase [Alphaproteobacteria bacterium SO-S41]
MSLSDVPITIVGGGPVGLSMALVLSRQGIASRVLEINATTTDHPKARGVWIRAMEIFRQWGVYQPIKDRGLPDASDSMVLMDGIDREIARTAPEPFNDESPARKSIVAQDAVEEALAAELKNHPLAQVYWRTEFVGVEETPDGLRITANDLRTGETLTWNSTYLIGADGGKAGVAKLAGIEFEGPPVMATMLNTYFRADLSRFPAARDAAGLYFRPRKPEDDAFNILNTNGADRWLWLNRIGLERDERPRPLTEAETIARIRYALGVDDIKIELINESVWRVTRRIAKTFRKGRIFLVGDAAHRFPPYGGFGMNSGVQDAHNLAWKLAFVLAGKAGDALLDTYDTERRPIAHANADIALVNGARIPHLMDAHRSGDPDRIRFWLQDSENHIHSIGHTLGFVYEKGALVPDHTTPPDRTPRYYKPTDRPGSRYPHFWLDDARTTSSLDLFDRDFVLMIGPEADAWEAAAKEVAQARGIPIHVHRLASVDPKKGFAVGPHGAALVRPDGVTAWRTGWVGAQPAQDLATVLDAILA